MIPINPDGLIIAAYFTLGAIILLCSCVLGIIFSKSFRRTVLKHKLLSFVLALFLVTFSSPPFISAYRTHQEKLFQEEFTEHKLKYSELDKDTAINGTTFPKGTRFGDWFIDYCNDKQFEFTEATIPHETTYHGLFVNNIKRRQWNCWSEFITLSRPQLIEGWLCAANIPISIDFSKHKGEQLIYCRLSKQMKNIGSFSLPQSQVDSNTVESRLNDNPPTWVIYGNNRPASFHSMKFVRYSLTLSRDKQKLYGFSGKLAEDSVVSNTEYRKNDVIDLESLLRHIDAGK